MPVLRISDVPVGAGRRVEVTWQDGPARRAAVATFGYRADGREAEQVRWYLEDYPEFPADPAPVLAAKAEARLARTGAELFRDVFAGPDGAVIWGLAQARLAQLRVEIDTDPAEAPGLPWELLRDPGTDTALATGAGEFVRTHLQTAGQVVLPEAAGDELRVLLVICRPGGGEDVPFRSVASRLVRGGAEQMEGLRLEVLRPATYPRLAEVLHRAADAGRPYHVVHFDGHGTYLDVASLQADEDGDGEPARATSGGGGGQIAVSRLRYGMSVAGPVREGAHGYLIFEDPGSGANQQLADGPALGRLLTATGVPVLVLNACRSAWAEAPARAFDAGQAVLLSGFAGAGKTSTAAEFARWYAATGGLDHRDLGAGPVLWSSFEHHLRLDRLLDAAGDAFGPLLEANGIHWQAITDPGQRRALVLRLLAQVPVLWVWDNTEPVTGFPPGTPSAWTPGEQDQIAGFLADLGRQTRCKVLLTSRRDERAWLGGLPARIELPPMPMRERLQLAHALAAGYPGHDPGTDWRPLLRYAAGNPLTITVLVGQALRDHLTTDSQIEGFVARIRAGEAGLEAGQDAALGRARSLAASLSYGFTHAFTQDERAQLAVLHLFRDTVDADALRGIGSPDVADDDAIPQLAGLTRDTAVELLNRAAEIGLLSPLGGGYYAIHPALPWYFTTLYATVYGPPGTPDADRAAHAYTHTLAELGRYYHDQHETRRADVVPALGIEEGNLHHALTLALDAGHWADATGCLQGLTVLYQRTGRDGEWARLVAQVAPAFIDPATEGPLPGREEQWSIITGYRVRIATAARDWPAATRLQNLATAWDRDRAAAALAAPADQLTPGQRNEIRSLTVSLQYLGYILYSQEDPDCLPHLQEALTLAQHIEDAAFESNLASSLGNAYLDVPALRDLDQAQRWHQHSLDLEPEQNRVGRAQSLGSLARVAFMRFMEARAARQPEAVLLGHLNAALDGYQEALGLFPADDAENLATVHHLIGVIYRQAGDTRRALHHYQQSIKHEEARGNTYGAGQTRYNIAVLLQDDGRPADALLYARAALHDFERTGPGAARTAAQAADLITELEQGTG